MAQAASAHELEREILKFIGFGPSFAGFTDSSANGVP